MSRPRQMWSAMSVPEALAAKSDRKVAVCLPAHNEEATVGEIVSALRRDLIIDSALIDDLVVIDDRSTDETAAIARSAGARVVATAADGRHGKGAALWTSLKVTDADFVVWIDADLHDFETAYVPGLLTPLLRDDAVVLSKGSYERPVGEGDVGGRVTELVARPLLHLLHPALAHIDQPLGGEYACRRSALRQVPFARGYGVEIAMLIDVAERFGIDSIAQVELGIRQHRRRRLLALEPQATEIIMVALERAGVDVPDSVTIHRRGSELRTVGVEYLPAHDRTHALDRAH